MKEYCSFCENVIDTKKDTHWIRKHYLCRADKCYIPYHIECYLTHELHWKTMGLDKFTEIQEELIENYARTNKHKTNPTS